MIWTTRRETKTRISYGPLQSYEHHLALLENRTPRPLCETFAAHPRRPDGPLVVFYSVPETPLEPYEPGFRNRIEGVWARAAQRSM